jgi:hypothetical protein
MGVGSAKSKGIDACSSKARDGPLGILSGYLKGTDVSESIAECGIVPSYLDLEVCKLNVWVSGCFKVDLLWDDTMLNHEDGLD